ncbi:hypothetical protein ACHAWO_001396 [Cyclotella atomus]|uniref:Uncharacterized protein n=1 Tax=Cyclotella atomus TaxID=382360 RepID=A0ABD3QPT1_9STRA
MPISEAAQRAWKAGTAVLTFATSYYCIFHVEYGQRDHCFTGIQRWYWGKIDGMLGIEKEKVKQNADGNDAGSSR